MHYKNQMKLIFSSLPENESFARLAVSAFVVSLNPTLDILADIKTAVSEAVTNAVVHAYKGQTGMIEMSASLSFDGMLYLSISDVGCGISDIEQALQPFYTSQPEKERSGMGFCVMQTFMDDLQVESKLGAGTTVRMKKQIAVK